MKTCTKCQKQKSESEFFKRSNRPCGLQSACKVCSSLQVRAIGRKDNRYNQYRKRRRQADIQYKLTESLRNRLRMALKGNQKGVSAISDLGCSMSDFKLYLESKFQPGMSWENHGYRGWHIDHIKPLALFDLADPVQFKQACHYTNLQPLWAQDNFTKGARGVLK